MKSIAFIPKANNNMFSKQQHVVELKFKKESLYRTHRIEHTFCLPDESTYNLDIHCYNIPFLERYESCRVRDFQGSTTIVIMLLMIIEGSRHRRAIRKII